MTRGRTRTHRLVAVVLLFTAACSGLTDESRGGLDVDAVLGDLRDCSQLLDVFVSVVTEATAEVDRAAADGTAVVEMDRAFQAVNSNEFFQGIQRLGCAQTDMRADAARRIGQIRPGTASGEAFLRAVIDDLAPN